jgi:hypothetical protein
MEGRTINLSPTPPGGGAPGERLRYNHYLIERFVVSNTEDIMDGRSHIIGSASPVGVMVPKRRSPKRRLDFAALTG